MKKKKKSLKLFESVGEGLKNTCLFFCFAKNVSEQFFKKIQIKTSSLMIFFFWGGEWLFCFVFPCHGRSVSLEIFWDTSLCKSPPPPPSHYCLVSGPHIQNNFSWTRLSLAMYCRPTALYGEMHIWPGVFRNWFTSINPNIHSCTTCLKGCVHVTGGFGFLLMSAVHKYNMNLCPSACTMHNDVTRHRSTRCWERIEWVVVLCVCHFSWLRLYLFGI